MDPMTLIQKEMEMLFRKLTIVLVAFLLSSCDNSMITEGEGYIEVEGGKVWYNVVGTGSKTPLLLLHGGPGFTSHYLNPLAELSDERPVIFYDQLGAGRSDRTDDPALWTIENFVEELSTLRTALGLKQVHILGHSWGTQLAMEYMQTGPKGVKSLILASPAINTSRWTEDNKKLLSLMPESTQATIRRHEQQGTTDSDEFQAAMMEYYARHISRSDPWSDDTMQSFESFNGALYEYMWGPADWAATGTLKDYNRESDLSSLNLPVLFTTGRYDEAVPETVEYYQSLTPDSKLVILENSAHLTMQDEPKENVRIIREFLRSLE
jgi:proline iminopeptidase